MLKDDVDFFLVKMGIKPEVEAAWNSGVVTIPKLKGNSKTAVMNKKSALMGSRIFVEHDLGRSKGKSRKKREARKSAV